MKEELYFAYGSNMNLHQMAYRCPKASVIGNVHLKDYRLTFCGRNPDRGVASIKPEPGSQVDGVLWKVTEDCKVSLDYYEGYPYLYGRQIVTVETKEGVKIKAMVYVMNEPFRSSPAAPSSFYLNGILEGCMQNHLSSEKLLDAVKQVKEEIKHPKKTKEYTR